MGLRHLGSCDVLQRWYSIVRVIELQTSWTRIELNATFKPTDYGGNVSIWRCPRRVRVRPQLDIKIFSISQREPDNPQPFHYLINQIRLNWIYDVTLRPSVNWSRLLIFPNLKKSTIKVTSQRKFLSRLKTTVNFFQIIHLLAFTNHTDRACQCILPLLTKISQSITVIYIHRGTRTTHKPR